MTEAELKEAEKRIEKIQNPVALYLSEIRNLLKEVRRLRESLKHVIGRADMLGAVAPSTTLTDYEKGALASAQTIAHPARMALGETEVAAPFEKLTMPTFYCFTCGWYTPDSSDCGVCK